MGDIGTFVTATATVALVVVTVAVVRATRGVERATVGLVDATKELARSSAALEELARIEQARRQAEFRVEWHATSPRPPLEAFKGGTRDVLFDVVNVGWHPSAIDKAFFLFTTSDGKSASHPLILERLGRPEFSVVDAGERAVFRGRLMLPPGFSGAGLTAMLSVHPVIGTGDRIAYEPT